MTAARLVRLLTILAVLLAPLGMVGGHAAMAMPAPAAGHMAPPADHHGASAGDVRHCDDPPAPAEDERSARDNCLVDCAVACSAIPAAAAGMGEPLVPAVVEPAALAARISGLRPGADPPPPRLS